MVNGETGHPKSWHVNVYLALYSLAGIGLAAVFAVKLIGQFAVSPNLTGNLLEYAVLIAMLTICRSYPLPTRKGQVTDISIILLYATLVLKGLPATVVAVAVSAFFTFEKRDGKTVSQIFNTSVIKSLFNNANFIVSVCAGWLAFNAVGGKVGLLGMPGMLLPSLLFLLVTLLVNSISMFMVLKLVAGIPYFSSLAGAIRGTLPTLLAFAPIGYFLALIFQMRDGPYLAMLFFVPLLFARYAFKLYIDSKEQYLRTISTLTAAIEAKDEYTEGHSRRVAQIAVEVAQGMRLSSVHIENIKVASVLHDIGKIGIADEILRKPGKLTQEEWGKIIQHPNIGVKILEEVAMPPLVKEIIQYHHVRYDRGGYPPLEPGKQVSLEVHIVSLADAYDAMTSDRPYRNALSEETALGIIRQERGIQFHPEVVDAFLKLKQKDQRA